MLDRRSFYAWLLYVLDDEVLEEASIGIDFDRLYRDYLAGRTFSFRAELTPDGGQWQ